MEHQSKKEIARLIKTKQSQCSYVLRLIKENPDPFKICEQVRAINGLAIKIQKDYLSKAMHENLNNRLNQLLQSSAITKECKEKLRYICSNIDAQNITELFKIKKEIDIISK